MKIFQAQGLPAALGLAIARIESNFNPVAVNLAAGDKKRGGAYGLCQITYKTAQLLGFNGQPENLYEPKLNISLAAKLCDSNASRVKHPFDSLEWRQDVLSSYNCGKPYLRAPHITRDLYVPKGLEFYAFYEQQLKSKAPSSAPTKALT